MINAKQTTRKGYQISVRANRKRSSQKFERRKLKVPENRRATLDGSLNQLLVGMIPRYLV